MKRRFALLSVIVCVVLAAACKPTVGPTMTSGGVANPPFLGQPPQDPYVFNGTGTYGGMFVMSIPSDPGTFNPITSTDSSSNQIIQGPVFTTLLGLDNITQEISSGMASSYEASADGLVWTFHLRKGLMWSDGTPFTAADVKFSFDVTFDPKIDNSAKSSFEQSDHTYPLVEAVDDLTVRFTLKEPNGAMLINVGTVYLVPKHKLEAAWKAGTFSSAWGIDVNPAELVTCGPYRLIEYVANQRVVLERNPYYWKVDSNGQRLPYIDRVVIEIVADMNTALLNFKAGQTDMMYTVKPEDVPGLRAEEAAKDFKVYDLGPGFNVYYFMVNQNPGRSEKSGKPFVDPVKIAWFTDVKFRQALSYAIDREAMVKTIFNGFGVPVYSQISPANKEWYDEASIVKYPHDIEKAKALLKEIGMEDRDGDGVIEDSKGHPVSFKLTTNGDNNQRIAMATLLKNDFKSVGIDVSVNAIPFQSVIKSLQELHDFDSVIGGWQSGNPPDPILSNNIYLSNGFVHYSNPNQKTPATPWEARIDELMNANQRTVDIAVRKERIKEVLHLWSENLPEIDLVAANYFVAAKNRFGNFRPSALPYYTYWNLDELYLTK